MKKEFTLINNAVPLDKMRCFILCLLMGLSFSFSYAQNSVSGKVLDKEGLPLPGVTVLLKNTKVSSTTDFDGLYKIDISGSHGGSIEFSYIGFKNQSVAINNQKVINVTMLQDLQGLDEVIVVGYGKQKKTSVIGSVTQVSGGDLEKASNIDVINNLTGRAPGVRVIQLSSEPGKYDTQIDIRGYSYTPTTDNINGTQQGGPLFVIDGVQRSQAEFSRLDPASIQSVSVLKDASAAVYGLKAANGVVLVTTKTGNGKFSVSYSEQLGVQQITKYPSLSNAYQYAVLYNEMQVNNQISGRTEPSQPKYTNEQLENFRTGKVPSTDWLGLIMNESAMQQQRSLTVSGSTEKVKYFFSAGYFDQDGLYKSGISWAKKYNMRMNVRAELAKDLTFGVNLGFIDDISNSPQTDTWQLLKNTWKQNPAEQVYVNGNPNYYTQLESGEAHPLAEVSQDMSGYKRNDQKFLNSVFDLEYKVPFVEGLKTKLLLAYDLNYSFNKSFKKKYDLYDYDAQNDIYRAFTHNNPSSLTEYFGQSVRKDLQFSFTYDKRLGKHNIGALALYEQIENRNNNFNGSTQFVIDAVDQLAAGVRATDRVGSGFGDSSNKSFVGRTTYDFANKYLFEFSFRYDGSSNFPAASRWGFFPSVFLGWRISEEAFMKKNLPFVTNLKIRGSVGKLGDDQAANFQYLTGYTYPADGGYQFGNNWLSGLGFKNSANPNITWYTSTLSNIGIEGDLWNKKLSFTVDFFRRNRDGLLAYRNTTLPDTYGVNLPQENLNGDRTQGYELELGHASKIGNVNYSISANLTYTRTENQYREETPASNDYDQWRNKTANRYNDLLWGYKTAGQFKSYEEIYNAPIIDGAGNRTVLPGDIRYVDVNGDGIISNLDETVIGKVGGKPAMYFGTNINVSWKNIDFSMLFQGAAKYQVYYEDQLAKPFNWGVANPITIFNDRWHREDVNDPNSTWVEGKYPSTGERSNYKTNDYWLRDASYLRIKTIQIGYSLPKEALKSFKIDNIRLFASAYNVFTWNKGLDFVDPEYTDNRTYSYNYPITMNMTLGIQLNF